MLEDSLIDMELISEQLSNAGYRLDVTHVENEAGFTASLRENSFNLILADFQLPGFDAFGALKISQELCPETPFICVSGNIGEETAVELLKLGALDYVFKDKPERLPMAVKRALEEAERKADYQKTAEKLWESEEKMRSIYSTAPAGIGVVVNRMLIEVNPRVCEMTGYSREELIGKNTRILYPSLEEYEFVGKENYDQIKEKRIDEVETHWQKKDGSIINILLVSTPINISDYSKGVTFTALDITYRKRAEMIKQLQYNIARATITTKNLNELFDSVKNELNKIIDARNFVIAFYNKETGMLSANVDRDEEGEIPEWPAEKSLTGYVIEQNRPVILRKNEILRLHEKGIIEIYGTISEAWLGVPLKTEDGVIGAIVVQNYDNPDVYDQYSMEMMEALAHELSMFIDRQRSEGKVIKLSTAVEQSSVSIMITNRKGAIEYVNPFFTELTGYSFEEAKGKNPNILKSGHQSKTFYKQLWDTILSGSDWKGELLNKKKNGELYWVKAVVSPIVNSEDVITNFVAIKEDITERKKIIEELIIANKELAFQNDEKEKRAAELILANKELAFQNKQKEKRAEELVAAKEKVQENDKLKTAFINNISHEIRTPLNGILGFGSLLLEADPSPEDKEEMLAYMQHSSNRLVNTVTDYMDMAQIVSNTMEVQKKELLLQAFFEEVIEEKKQLCAGKKIGFEADYQNNVELTLDSDPALISKILNILFDNALKFTTRGKISCGYKVKDEFVEFFVQDTGKGIAPGKLDVIFNMFTQEDSSYTRAHEGSGLGLTIARGMVKLLGGTISITSEQGIGSTFAITVPYKEESLTQKAPPEEEKNVPVAGKPLVLVAEDEESNAMYLEVVLKKAGCDYLLTDNGKEAVALCKKHSDITLVLMDIKMPVMNGLEATKRIREFRPELPIIATTAYAQTGDEQRFLAAGCDGYLPKPIKKEKLMALFQKYLKS
ncbi:MAG: PAS domain S-box protein [Bacteroidales bacterium]|nr:PAS domain S-box protein [Bacteroidales bacterium]